MSRFKILKANPRRTLAALATVLVAVGITGASGANFTAQSANANNTFSAGSMHILNSKPGASIFTTSPNMRPGDSNTGTVDIKNDGTLSGTLKLTRGTLSDELASPKLSDQLGMVVTDCGADYNCTFAADNSNVYTGTLAAMTNRTLNNHTAGTTWAVDEHHLYEFVATLHPLTPDAYQGLSSTVQFDWTATS